MWTPDDDVVAAGHSVDPAGWRVLFDELMSLVAGRLARVEPRRTAREYREGDWFAVPLRDGGYAVGLIARANPGGVLLGYFFGPRGSEAPRLRGSEAPRLEDVTDLPPGDAVLIRKFGHLGSVRGKWQLLGRTDDWDRRDWPTPVFVRYEG